MSAKDTPDDLATPIMVTRQQLRALVDRVWNEATESEDVPHTDWADQILKDWISMEGIAPQEKESLADRADRNCSRPGWDGGL